MSEPRVCPYCKGKFSVTLPEYEPFCSAFCKTVGKAATPEDTPREEGGA